MSESGGGTGEGGARRARGRPRASGAWARYGVAVASVVGAALLTQLFYSAGIGFELPFAFFFGAVAVAALYGGRGPGLVSVLLSAVVANYFFLRPFFALSYNAAGLSQTIAFVLVALLVVHLTDRSKRAETAALASGRLLSTTLRSIGDAVISTDAAGRVFFMNPTAQELTGWPEEEARGRPLEEVFQIFNEETTRPAESPAARALREGVVVGLANHTVLVARDGRRVPIDDSAAPIRDASGATVGVVLVFHDITERRRAERALGESVRQYQYLADSMPQIVWTARADGHTDYFNQRWYDYTGLSAEQSLGWGWQNVVHPEDAEQCVRRWSRSVETGADYETEYRFRRGSDGAYRWHLGRARAQRDEEGRVAGWFGTATDIDDQKRTEETLRFLAEAESVLSSSLDVERTLESVARLAVPHLADFCLVDLAEGGAVQRAVVAHHDPEKEAAWREMQRRTPLDMEADAAIPKALRTGRAEVYEELPDELLGGVAQAEALRGFGVTSAMVVPLLARGRTVGALSFVSAESGRRYTRRDLATAADLARRAALAIDNAQLYRRAEEANRTKDEFLATLSHELRTPLTPITGWVHMLRGGRVSLDDLPHGLDVIERNTHSLTRLINDLLDMSAIMSGKMRIEHAPVELSAVVEQAAEAARAEAARRNVQVRVEVEPCEMGSTGDGAGSRSLAVSGDRTRLLQVFSNLLNNAVKFSRGGTVRVSCGRVGASVRVEVADEGEGIPAEFLPHVFERFRQADSTTTRNHGGLGLGLALVKSFIEAHGGRVSVESGGAGRGSRFAVTLPLLDITAAPAKPATSRRAAPPAEPAEPAGPRVLVVEDARDTLEMLEAVFASKGYAATLCETADEALGVASSARFDIIVSDIGLPHTDGYELIRLLRRVPALRDVPAVALTGYAAQKDADAALAAGFDLHIAKPVDPVALADAVEQLLRRKSGRT